MGYWVKQNEDKRMPHWLKKEISEKCNFCGAENENYYNDVGQCTNRRCSNPKCKEMLARKAYLCIEMLGLKGTGIGVETCRAKANSGVEDHLDILGKILDTKPKVTVGTVLRLCCFEGIDSMWNALGDNYDTVEHFIEKYDGDYKHLIADNKEKILKAASLVEVLAPTKFEYEPLVTGCVMLTGDIPGYHKREDFLAALRIATKGLINITYSPSVRKTGIMALIKEKNSPTTRKVETAKECMIPIYTSEEFKNLVLKKLSDKLKGE